MACPQLVPEPDGNLGLQGENLSASLLAVRFWNHDSSGDKLELFSWEADGTIAELCREVVKENCGVLIQSSAFLLARFEDPLRALAIAKTLQQALLPRAGTQQRQVIAAAAIHGRLPANDSDANQTDRSLQLLEVVPPAHILVSEEVFAVAKSAPDFAFETDATLSTNSKGESRRLYELYWTDPATYRALATMLHSAAINIRRSARYQTLAELGRGGMGVVYKAHDRVIDRVVALKTIAVVAEDAHRASLMRRLKQEAKAAGKLDHPNIVTIYDIGEEDGVLYLSMQFVEGETLSAVLARKKLPARATLLSYVDQICSAVGYAHQHGIVHRDLKPSNVMINAQGKVKVLDFGIAKLGDAGTTEAGAIIGTPDYMAPEQAAGRRIDHRSDIFSLGAMFYELFTGEKAFSAQSVAAVLFKVITDDPVPPSVLDPGLPRRISAAIVQALAKSPEDRFQSCEEMRQAFAHVAAPESESGEQSAPVATPTPMARPVLAEEFVAPSREEDGARAPTLTNVLTTKAGQPSVKLGAAASLVVIAAVILMSWSKPHKASPASTAKETAMTAPADLTPATPVPSAMVRTQNNIPLRDRAPAPAKEKPHSAKSASSGLNNSKTGASAKASLPPTLPATAPPESVNGFRAAEIPDILARADKLYGEGRYRDAITAYDNVLKLDPGNQTARVALNKARMVLDDKSHNH